jgi:H+-transporting ATPase
MDSFGMFYLGDRVFHLDRALIQTLMYLKLSVAGHFKIFLTRTRGPFWSIRPARILLVMVFGTQIVATLVAVYGVFMPPIGWGWAAMVWGYSLLWFLVNDRVKLLAYRIFDPVKEAEAKPNAIIVPKPETKAKPKPKAKEESKPEVKAEAKSDDKAALKHENKAKTPSDLTPQIATRAYELYEQQGRRDGQSVQNWDKAEREIRRDEATAEPKLDAIPEAKSEAKPEAKDESKLEAKAKTPSDLTPQIVKRVHELYEELGREGVRAVQDWEKAEREIRKDGPNK